MLISKKRYASMKYEFDINKSKLDYMGICLVRREYPKIVKHIY